VLCQNAAEHLVQFFIVFYDQDPEHKDSFQGYFFILYHKEDTM